MKYLIPTFGLFLAFLLSGCYHPTPQESFSDIQKITGNWTSYEGAKFNEKWEKTNDSLLSGIGFSLSGKDTAFAEKLLIKRIGDSVFYGALVDENREYIYFKLTEAGRNYWKFSNPFHDYPNIIEYKLENDTLLKATTSNSRGNKKIVFKLRKISS